VKLDARVQREANVGWFERGQVAARTLGLRYLRRRRHEHERHPCLPAAPEPQLEETAIDAMARFREKAPVAKQSISTDAAGFDRIGHMATRTAAERLALLRLVEQLGDVRAACKQLCFSRSSYYRLAEAYRDRGEAGLEVLGQRVADGVGPVARSCLGGARFSTTSTTPSPTAAPRASTTRQSL